MDEIYSLQLHESLELDSGAFKVTRVPGGWIYYLWCRNTNTEAIGVYVPFSAEFEAPGL